MEKRDKIIQIRVSPSEHARFVAVFGRHMLNMSAEIRAFLERKVKRLEKPEGKDEQV